MPLVAQLVVPGAGPLSQALSTAKELCSEMNELRFVCDRLHTRLENLLGELQLMECKGRVLSTRSLNKYTAAVGGFLHFLEQHSGKDLVYRVVKHKTLTNELKDFHDSVAVVLFELLDVTAIDEWEDSHHVLDAALASVIKDERSVMRDLQSPRAQLEALLTLKFEVEERAAQHEEKDLQRMELLAGTIASAARVTVEQLPPWFVPNYDVKVEPQPFARGSTGEVHRGAWRSGVDVVVKRFDIDDMAVDSRAARKMENEMNLRFQMDHPNIAKVYGASHVSSNPFLVCEDATHGDLGSFLSSSDDSKQHMWKLLDQAALGLDYLHKQGVVHGHLKLSNILVGDDNRAKLSDFGLSTMRAISKATSISSSDLRWRAPECLKRRPTFASDVYSFAMCMIEAAIGEPPYAYLSDEDVRENLKHGEIPQQPDEMDDDTWELVTSMTDVDPAKRIGLDLVIEKLSKYAGGDTVASANDASARCSVCDALVFDRSRNCAQCGNCIFIKEQVHLSPRDDFPLESESPRASPDLTTSTSVVDLIEAIRAGSDDEQEGALLLLLQACLHDAKRRQISEENGLPVLVDLVKNGRTHFIKMCAFGCLSWSSELDSTITDGELETLRRFVRLATDHECISLVNDLRDGNDTDKLKTVVNCSCIAEAKGRKQLRAAGVVPLLVRLLKHGNEALTIWTMDTLGNLASDDEIKSAIVADRAIPRLVRILRGGTEIQRGFAAYVLGQLSTNNGPNSAAVVNTGAIPFLVGLLRAQASIPKTFAAYALGLIAANSDSYCEAIAEVGGITRLVQLLRTGVNMQKEYAATALGWLANQEVNRLVITQEGAIADLIGLVRRGTDGQKENAAFALSFLASDSMSSVAMVNDGAIAPLVKLLRTGTEEQQEHAACTLANLAGCCENCVAIASEGGITPLVNLLRTGRIDLKGLAAYTLGCIGTASEDNRISIVSDEVVELLVELIRAGTVEEKNQAMFGLCYLTKHGHKNANAIASGVAIAELIPFLRNGLDEQKHFVATALGCLAIDNMNKRTIARCGAISPLIDLLKTDNAANKEQAVIALGRLATDSPTNSNLMKQKGVVALLKTFRRTGTRQ